MAAFYSRRPGGDRRDGGGFWTRSLPNPLRRLRDFFTETIWDEKQLERGRLQRFFFPKLRIVFLVVQGYWNHDLATSAAALTFASLLALVPCLAVAFSIFQAFPGALESAQEQLKAMILKNLAPGFPEKVETWIDRFVENVRLGVRANATIATIILFATVVNMIPSMETTFNGIWGDRRSRNFYQKFTTYWAVATLGPVLVGASFAMTASLLSSSFVAWIETRLPVVAVFYRLAPVVLACAAFTILYFFLPNTAVRVRAALVGGVVAGLAFELAKRAFAASSEGLLTSYNADYSGIATLFVFFLWLFVSWTITLLGMEFVFATQTATTHRREELAARISQKSKELIALRLTVEVAERFYRGDIPISALHLAQSVDIPLRLVNDIRFTLHEAGIVKELDEGAESYAFVPGRMLEKIAVRDVIAALREHRGETFKLAADDEGRTILGVVGQADAAAADAYAGESMRTIVERLEETKKKRAEAALTREAKAAAQATAPDEAEAEAEAPASPSRPASRP